VDAIQGCSFHSPVPQESGREDVVRARSRSSLYVATGAEGRCGEDAGQTTRIALRSGTMLTAALRAPTESGDTATDRAGSDGTAIALKYQRTEKTSLMIRTQEGDVVRLRFRISDLASVEGAESRDGDSQLAELDLKAQSAVRLKVFVKGDLNADELAAIQSVVQQAGRLANEFFAGDALAAFASASSLEVDSQQLAKVAIRMRVREQLSYSQSATALSLPLVPAGAGTADTGSAETGSAAEAASDAPVQIATAPASAETPAADAAPAAADTVDGAPVADAADASAAPVEATAEPDAAQAEEPAAAEPATPSVPGNPYELLSTMLSFLTRLMEAFSQPAQAPAVDATTAESGEAETGGTTFGNVEFSLKLRIFTQLIASATIHAEEPAAEEGEGAEASATPDEAAAVTTLTDAVEAIAANAEPPLETVA